jgi:ubiquinone/menaquinone biosynthesis C-methylase UbiE
MQEHQWEREYRKPQLLTKENKPQADTVRFAHFLRKKEGVDLATASVLDLGCGTGRNSFYFAEMGARVVGLDISRTAIELAKQRAGEAGLDIAYFKQSIGERFPVPDASIGIALDVTSSNSLTEAERETYLAETQRVLAPNGYFFVKALCKDGDTNAKQLLKQFPGPEKDTYIMPDIGITERVWSKEDFLQAYQRFFTILHLEKKTSYSQMNNRSYKRNFWIAYLKKV